jgi:hypothetical protein
MKSLPHALHRAIPRFQKFRMRQSQVATTNDFGFLRLAQLIRVVTEQFSPVFFKPYCQSLPILRLQSKNCFRQLLQTHVLQFTKLERAGESEILCHERREADDRRNHSRVSGDEGLVQLVFAPS